MKQKIIAVVLIVVLALGTMAWLILGNGTAFTGKTKYIYVKTGKANETEVMNFIRKENLVRFPAVFSRVASQLDIWKKLKPGRYEIKQGESLLAIARKLRNNQQSPVRLVINKLRIPEDLAKAIGKNLEVDSLEVIQYLHAADNLSKLGVDTNSLMTLVIPNTYNILWSSSVSTIMERLKTEQEKFWEKNDRLAKAERLGFSPQQVYTIASIVEEETNKHDEKGNVASVYINRYHKGMPLGADPTIKFALKDFGLRRIYFKHLEVASPYNTYKNRGLPPGPIATPSPITIDAVLDAPATEYIFFVAKSDFSGYHTFTTNFADHKKYAREYQEALNAQIIKRQSQPKNEN